MKADIAKDVRRWLATIDFSQYADAFEANDIDMDRTFRAIGMFPSDGP